jgi:hypothetical protein
MRAQALMLCGWLMAAPLPASAAKAVWGWEEDEDIGVQPPVEERRPMESERGGWEVEVIEPPRRFVAPEPRGSAAPARRNRPVSTDPRRRWVNPHPERGCLYYDENNKRHWFPGCRER